MFGVKKQENVDVVTTPEHPPMEYVKATGMRGIGAVLALAFFSCILEAVFIPHTPSFIGYVGGAFYTFAYLLVFSVCSLAIVKGVQIGKAAYAWYRERKFSDIELITKYASYEQKTIKNDRDRSFNTAVNAALPEMITSAQRLGHNVDIDYTRGSIAFRDKLSNLHTLSPGSNIIEQASTSVIPVVPTFAQIISDGTILDAIRQGKIIVGYENGIAIYASWAQVLKSCGIGGLSGSGKTTTTRFILFQTVLLGARFIMIDPHLANEEESLAAQFKPFKNVHQFMPCDDTEGEVMKRVQWLKNETEMRIKSKSKGAMIILVIDELNGLLRRLSKENKKILADLLLTIAQEGRKYNIFCLLIAQRWAENDLGGKNYGASIRDSLYTSFAHRFKSKDQAEMLLGSNDNRVVALATGHFLFRNENGELVEMVTPETYASDAIAVQSLLDNSQDTTDAIRALPQNIQNIHNVSEDIQNNCEDFSEYEMSILRAAQAVKDKGEKLTREAIRANLGKGTYNYGTFKAACDKLGL